MFAKRSGFVVGNLMSVWMAIANVTLITVSAILLVPAIVLFAQLLAGSRSQPSGVVPRPAPSGWTIAVLMPAHDEAVGIAPAIRAVLEQLGPDDRLLVVADNCTDDTAAIALALGAEVVERADRERRGKGYALDFGVRALAETPPDVVVIIDADCVVREAAIRRLAARCATTPRPVQALYLMHAPEGAPLGTRIAAFAWVVKNKVRPLGAAAFGWPCQLMGTGMAFRWTAISTAPLASGHLVEDMQLGLAMARAGTPPLFCAEAEVSSVFPLDRGAVQSQRTRWEHGHLSMIGSVAPRLLLQALRRADWSLLGLVLDLTVPPLAALVLGLSALLALDAAWWLVAGNAWPLTLSAAAFMSVGIGVIAAWRQEGRNLVSARELAALPRYVAAKIPLYLRLVTRRQTQWIRTKRDDRRP